MSKLTDKARKILSKATPGPWKFVKAYTEEEVNHKTYKAPGHYDNLSLVGPDGIEIVGCGEYDVFGDVGDRELLLRARELIEELCDEIESLEAQPIINE